MPISEIITIGTELLLGEITDTNSTYIARTLRDYGIDIYRITTIGDNPGRIASTIKEALKRADIVITTGGLGPTIDDPTRQSVAAAADRALVFEPDLWEQILERFKAYGRTPTENNRRQAYIPQGAIKVNNPVGTAPCFIVEIEHSCIISLPGVPKEMEFILRESVIPYLSQNYELKSQIIKATVLHAASIGESMIDEKIEDLEQLANPTVGLLAHPGQVDIRVTAKAESGTEAQKLSKPIIEELFSRLGNYIYGIDGETLEGTVSQNLNQNQQQLALIEFGMNGSFISRLNHGQPNSLKTQIINTQPADESDFLKQVLEFQHQHLADIGFGIALTVNDRVTVQLAYVDSRKSKLITRSYGGPKEHAHLWAQNTGLDFLRRQILNI